MPFNELDNDEQNFLFADIPEKLHNIHLKCNDIQFQAFDVEKSNYKYNFDRGIEPDSNFYQNVHHCITDTKYYMTDEFNNNVNSNII